jgi:hypothetical protein
MSRHEELNALTKKCETTAPSLAENPLQVHSLRFDFVIHIFPSGQLLETSAPFKITPVFKKDLTF